ncbi:MAG: hypothetical protein U5N86_14080 [Planctomycetota bacterium]|nr:hypothetical protein [Planctomycetota bacterium]
MTVYNDTKKLQERFDDADGLNVNIPLIFSGLQYSALDTEGEDITDSFRLVSKSLAEHDICRQVRGQDASHSGAKFVPEQYHAYLAANIPSLSSIFGDDGEDAGAAPPRGSKRLYGQMLGISITDTLFNQVGSEVKHLLPEDRGIMSHEILAIAPLKDPELVKQTLDDIAIIPAKKIISRSELPDGSVIYSLSTGEMNQILPMAFAIRDGHLIMGTIYAVKPALKRSMEDSLAATEEFADLKARHAQFSPNLLLGLNMPKIASVGYPLWKMQYIRMIAREDNPEIIMFPPVDALAKHMRLTSLAARITEDGYAANSRGMLPVSLLQMMAGQLFMAFSAQRVIEQPLGRDDPVLLRVLNFHVAAVDFSYAQDEKSYWESENKDFGEYFDHQDNIEGYSFFYFSDDTNLDGKHEAKHFIYLAVPEPINFPVNAYAVDETGHLYTKLLKNNEQWNEFFKLIDQDAFDWNKSPHIPMQMSPRKLEREPIQPPPDIEELEEE